MVLFYADCTGKFESTSEPLLDLHVTHIPPFGLGYKGFVIIVSLPACCAYRLSDSCLTQTP